MGAALRTIGERFRGQPLAGVLLLTDGNATDLPDGKLDATGLPPIYPVVIGRDDTINDIAIQKIAVSQTAFEDQPVTVQAEVLAGGYGGRMITAQLLDQDGKVVQELNQRATRDSDTFRFQLRPEKSGDFLLSRAGLGQGRTRPVRAAGDFPRGDAGQQHARSSRWIAAKDRIGFFTSAGGPTGSSSF